MDISTWYVLDYEKDGKRYAYAHRIHGHINLVSFMADLVKNGLVSMNACETKKKACEIAESWNNTYKANGTYMFAETF